MKRNQIHRVLSGLFATGLLMSGAAFAVDSETATATVAATVVVPVTLGNTQGLDFGKFAKPLSGTTTVIMDTADGRTGTADLISSGSTPKSAAFTVNGDTTLAYTATVSYTAAIGTGLTLSAVKAKCGGTAETLISGAGATGGTVSCALTGGTDALTLGATLTVGTTAETLSGADPISVTVAYN